MTRSALWASDTSVGVATVEIAESSPERAGLDQAPGGYSGALEDAGQDTAELNPDLQGVPHAPDNRAGGDIGANG